MVLVPVLSLAIAAPKGRKSFTIVWSTSMLRSASNKMRFFRPAFHRRQMIWNAVYVLPVPVAITRRMRCCPLAMASMAALMALHW
jgi:hypothetical protein